MNRRHHSTPVLPALWRTLGGSLADAGVPVLWVTHDLDQARRLADEVLVIIDGQAWGPAAPDALGGSPSAVQSFWRGRRAG